MILEQGFQISFPQRPNYVKQKFFNEEILLEVVSSNNNNINCIHLFLIIWILLIMNLISYYSIVLIIRLLPFLLS